MSQKHGGEVFEMGKIVSMLLLLFAFLQAEAVVKIMQKEVKLNDFTINYFVDHEGHMCLSEVLEQTFQTGPNRLSLGINAHVTWVKLLLQNNTEITQTLHIQNRYTYHASEITYYAFDKKEKLVRSITFKPREKLNTDKMDGAISTFKVTIPPGERRMVLMHSKFQAYQMIDLKIFDAKHAIQNLVHEFMWVLVLSSILFTLAGYYLILYLLSRHIEYLYYSLYLIVSSVFISYSYGMFTHYFHLYGKITLYLNATVILAPIFLVLFVRSVFNTNKKHPIEEKLLLSLLVVFALTYLYSFFDYYKAIEMTSLIYLYQLVVMLGVAVSLYIKKVPLSDFFLAAHLFNIIFTAIALMYYNNIIPANFLTAHAVAIGTMIEAMLLGFLVSYRIKILEEANQKKDAIILTDMMTSLYNKSYFEEILQKELKRHRSTKHTLGLLIIDIDYFKKYNDTYGHLAGDNALRSVATVLKESLKRTEDMAFRIGGEEFAIICTNTDREQLFSCANSIQEKVKKLRIEHKGNRDVSPYLTVSIGGYISDRVILENAKKLYTLADDALYRAKKEGRNRVVVFEKSKRGSNLSLINLT